MSSLAGTMAPALEAWTADDDQLRHAWLEDLHAAPEFVHLPSCKSDGLERALWWMSEMSACLSVALRDVPEDEVLFPLETEAGVVRGSALLLLSYRVANWTMVLRLSQLGAVVDGDMEGLPGLAQQHPFSDWPSVRLETVYPTVDLAHVVVDPPPIRSLHNQFVFLEYIGGDNAERNLALMKQIIATAEMDLDVIADEQSVMHVACQEGTCELVECLLARGASVVLPDLTSGWTPIHHAAQWGRLEVLTLLLEHAEARGESVMVRDMLNRTPMHLAARNGNTAEVDALADANCLAAFAQDASGCTPSDLAAENGHDYVVQQLRKAESRCRALQLLLGVRGQAEPGSALERFVRHSAFDVRVVMHEVVPLVLE